MDYTVLASPSVARLTEQVKQALKTGWKLAGGIAVLPDPHSPTGNMFLQAITK